MKPALLANITWNNRGWTFPEIHSQAGHGYARNNPGHECLNFVFNKPDIDNDTWVYGHFQRSGDPQFFEKDGLVIFYSRDFYAQVGKIVGIYGGAEVIGDRKFLGYAEFEGGRLIANVRADPKLSLRFPVYLNSAKYFRGRVVGQVGFRYFEDDNVSISIIKDEIAECEKIGKIEDVLKLQKIFEYYTGKQYSSIPTQEEVESEQYGRELKEIEKLSEKPIDIETMLASYSKPGLVTDDVPQKTIVNNYVRDPKLAALMKIKNHHHCQVCEKPTFESKDGNLYTESHHVMPRGKGGADDPKNILITCPTCHKKFDKGNEKTLIEVYRILKKKKLFSNFETLKKIGEISEKVYQEIIKE